MVYIYAFLGRLFVYPYLTYRASRYLPDDWCRHLYLYLLIEFVVSSLGLLLHPYIMHPVMSILMTLNIFAFFSAGYATVFVMLSDALRYIYKRIKGQPRWASSRRDRERAGVFVVRIAMLIFVGCAYFGYRNVADLKLVHKELRLGDSGRKLRIALATDIHIGEGITQSYIERIVSTIQEQQPDLILIGGDYIDHYGKFAFAPEVRETMKSLHAPEGVYYVPGNHEYRADSLAKLTWVSEVGGTLLLDSIVYNRDKSFALIGRDDFVHHDSRKPLDSLLGELRPQALNILLEHTPEGLDSLEHSPIDLALYGHTHGGQIFPGHLLVWYKYGITSGEYKRGKTSIYVSSGAGSAGAPYRIGTRSEVVIYDVYY